MTDRRRSGVPSSTGTLSSWFWPHSTPCFTSAPAPLVRGTRSRRRPRYRYPYRSVPVTYRLSDAHTELAPVAPDELPFVDQLANGLQPGALVAAVDALADGV